MDIRKIAWIGILCGAWCVSALAGAEEKATSSDADTSSTAAASKTYIESGPFGFVKIETILGGILGGKETAEDSRRSFDKQTNLWVLPFLEGSFTSKDPSELFHLSLLKVPLIGFWSSDTRGRLFAFGDDRNPFWPPSPDQTNTAFLDQPLFCFYDTVRFFSDTSVRQGNGQATISPSWQATRSRWLDTPLVSLWEMERWSKGKYYRYKFLDFLPLSTIAGEKGKSRSSFEVLDTSLVSVFGYENEEKKDNATGHVRSLYTCVASVWESRWKEGKKEWSFLAAPLCGGAKWRAEGEKERLTILGTESMDSRLPGRGGAPLTALWHQQREGKDTSTQQFLRVPLIGPVWAAWEDKEESRWGIFPRLFFWKKFRY